MLGRPCDTKLYPPASEISLIFKSVHILEVGMTLDDVSTLLRNQIFPRDEHCIPHLGYMIEVIEPH